MAKKKAKLTLCIRQKEAWRIIRYLFIYVFLNNINSRLGLVGMSVRMNIYISVIIKGRAIKFGINVNLYNT